MSKDLRFRISSALKSIIGKDLITDDFAAIFELVKNSFDADATKVEVNFNLTSSEKSSILVADDGHGMNENDLYEKWLFIAHSAKKDGTESSTRKTFAGYKGIGRFSCDRLGGTLRIQSKTQACKVVHNLFINWGSFEKNSKVELKDVSVHYEEKPEFEIKSSNIQLEHGVVLEISSLREQKSWDRKKLLRLRRALSKLVSPFQELEDQATITLKCEREAIPDIDESSKKRKPNSPEPQLVNGPITNDILDVLEGKTTSLDASIDPQGNLIVQLIDRGELIYETTESVGKQFPNLLDADFRCRLSFLNQAAKLTFGRRMGIPSVQYGSVFIIRNGFLVYPTGEENDDHWGLNRRKQQG